MHSQRRRSVRVYVALSGASAFLNATMFTQLTLFYVTRAGMNPLQLVLVGTFLEVTAFLCQVPTGLFADVHGRRRSVVIGTLVAGAAFVFIGLVPRFDAIAAGLCVWAVGATFVSGAREAWIVDDAGQDGIAAVFLRATQARQAGGLAGAVASAALARLDLAAPIAIGGVLTVVLALGLLRWMPETGFGPERPGSGRPSGTCCVRSATAWARSAGVRRCAGSWSSASCSACTASRSPGWARRTSCSM